MRRIRLLLCVLLALCTLLPCLPAALAEEAAGEDERFAGKTWDQVVADFLAAWGVDADSVAMGYYNTVTGEEHYLNPDQYMVTGSMYKVPLNMIFVDRITAGEMDWDTLVSGVRYETLLEETIVHSSDKYAKLMWDYLGKGTYRPYQTYRRILAPYMGEDPDTVDEKFYENNFFTPRQMIFCLKLLYRENERFPRIIETMQRAEPTEYFKRRERRFNIAHKYGFFNPQGHLYMNDCGIAFTDDPIIIVLFTDNLYNAYDVLTEYCTLMCDYAQYSRTRRLEEEAAEAERQRQEEEERARREAEEALQSPQPGALPEGSGPAGEKSSPGVQLLVRRAEKEGLSKAALAAAGLTGLALLTALILLTALGRRFRVRAGLFRLAALLLCLAALGRIFWPAVQTLRDRPSRDPRETVLAFFSALAEEDYAQAYGYLEHVDTLGLEYRPEDECEQAIFAAMRGRFSAELYGDCRLSGDLAYQQVSCRYFDVDKLRFDAKNQAMVLISRYASTHSVGDLYDESGKYRPELMREAWKQAVAELLEQPENYQSTGGVQLELRWEDGAWRIVPNEKLLQLLTGGVKLTEKEELP